VMRDGNVVEQGTHDELLALGGFYADLYNSQFERVEAEEEALEAPDAGLPAWDKLATAG